MNVPPVIKELWKDKPLFITVVVGLAALFYILYMNSKASVVAPTPTTNDGATGGGTYVQESYTLYAPTSNSSTTTTTSTGTSNQTTLPTIVAPAPKATLGTMGAGKGDTNFWVYTVTPGQTLASIAQMANWGSDTNKLVNYRNNSAILKAAGVNTANPYAKVPTGLQLSV